MTNKVTVKQAQQIANREMLSVFVKRYWFIWRCGVKKVCECDEIAEKGGIFSFIDSKTQEVKAILNTSEFAYATRNY